MTTVGFRINQYLLLACLLVARLLLCPAEVRADQAQYFYDELSRLVGVVDGQGDAAVYTYDEVGNLLSIEVEPILLTPTR